MCVYVIIYNYKVVFCGNFMCINVCQSAPQWGAADAEIKVPSGENTELKRSPFKAWSK